MCQGNTRVPHWDLLQLYWKQGFQHKLFQWLCSSCYCEIYLGLVHKPCSLWHMQQYTLPWVLCQGQNYPSSIVYSCLVHQENFHWTSYDVPWWWWRPWLWFCILNHTRCLSEKIVILILLPNQVWLYWRRESCLIYYLIITLVRCWVAVFRTFRIDLCILQSFLWCSHAC